MVRVNSADICILRISVFRYVRFLSAAYIHCLLPYFGSLPFSVCHRMGMKGLVVCERQRSNHRRKRYSICWMRGMLLPSARSRNSIRVSRKTTQCTIPAMLPSSARYTLFGASMFSGALRSIITSANERFTAIGNRM